MATPSGPPEDRWLRLETGTAELPERLLLAHSRGEVLFITGAGTSQPSGLPSFRDLVLRVYERVDPGLHPILVARDPKKPDEPLPVGLPPQQGAEVKRFDKGDYDVTLGMLERRIDGTATGSSRVRDAVCHVLRFIKNGADHEVAPRPAPIHKALMDLAVRGGPPTIVSTNFERLLQSSWGRRKPRPQTYSLGAMPRPSRQHDFSGVMHIHGVLSEDPRRSSEIVVTDRDFGEFYLRRRVVPDFIYDAARLFSLVLVGYSLGDAPMRYLLNAVAADGVRFTDLKERYAFVGMDDPFDPVELEDWKGRGITPIPYSSHDRHSELVRTLRRWADLSTYTGDPKLVDRELRRIVQSPRAAAPESDRDLFDHLVRRAMPADHPRISKLIKTSGAEIGWLTALLDVGRELKRGAKP